AGLPAHLLLRGSEVPPPGNGRRRASWRSAPDRAGRRWGRGRVPAGHRRSEGIGILSLQPHAEPFPAGGLPLRQPQGQEPLGDAQSDPEMTAKALRIASIVVAVDDHGEAFIVTVRDMTAGEKKTFRRKAR